MAATLLVALSVQPRPGLPISTGTRTGDTVKFQGRLADSSTYLPAGVDVRASVASDGTGGNDAWNYIGDDVPQFDGSGRYLAFCNDSSNLVPGGAGSGAVYLRDFATHTTTRLDVSSTGNPGNDASCSPSISSNGNLVVFQSAATNLVPNAPVSLLYLLNRSTGQLTNLTVTTSGDASNGVEDQPAISRNGRYVAFESDATNITSESASNPGVDWIYVLDLQTQTVRLASKASDGTPANSWADTAQVSNTGTVVSYQSRATNLGIPTGGLNEYVTNLTTGTTTALDVTAGDGGSGNAHISADGHWVSFETYGACTINIFDTTTGTNQLVPGTGCAGESNISADGSTISYGANSPSATDGCIDPMVYHRSAGTTYDLGYGAGQGCMDSSALSDDGSEEAFSTDASNLDFTDSNNSTDVYAANTDGPIGAIAGPTGPGELRGQHVDSESNPVCTCGDPVNPLTGTLTEQATDIGMPGRGFALALTRSYDSSMGNVAGPLGYGWTDNYDITLFPADGALSLTTATRIGFAQENGSTVIFRKADDGSWTAPKRVLATLTARPDGSFTVVRERRVTFRFDATGALTSEIDPNGYTTSLSRNADGSIDTITDEAGRQLTFAYASGRITRITDSAGRHVQYGYGSAGNLTDVTDPAGAHTGYGYDGNHDLTTVTDPRGHTTTTVYASATGRVSSQTDRANRTTTFDFTADSSRPLSGTAYVTDPRGTMTRLDYAFGLLTSRTAGSNTAHPQKWTYDYDRTTNATDSTTDPLGHTSTKSYDPAGNVTASTDPLGHRESWTYDALNDVLTHTDRNSVTTTNSYDSAGNLLASSIPLAGTGQTATVSYGHGDPTHPGDVTSVTDPLGKVSHFVYNHYGELVSRIDPAGDTTTYSYTCTPAGPGCRSNIGWLYRSVSARGNVAGADPDNYATSYIRDDAGRVLSVTDPLGHTSSYTYDDDGNTTSVTDPNNHTTRYSYDNDNEQTVTTRPDATTLSTGYDADGNVTSQSDSANHATVYGYDPLNRLASVTDPNNRTTSYGYDASGRLLTVQDPAGQITTNGYDAANRVTSVDYSDPATHDVTYSYDNDGRRTGMTDGTGTTSETYDSLGRITTITDGSGATVSYGYDLAGKATTITYPNGKTVSRSFDDAGRLINVTDWNHNAHTFGYDADSNLTSIGYPNGVTETSSVNHAGQITGVAESGGSGTLPAYTYTRDPAGQLTAAATTGLAGQPNETYGHSPLNQLAAYSSGAVNGAYSYDAADNPTGFPDGTSQTFDASNQLTSATLGGTTTNYGYDSRGDRITATTGGSTTTYGYDQANRLTSYQAGSTTASYSYNGDGLRVAKTVNSVTLHEAWDPVTGSVPLLLNDGINNYLYGPGDRPVEQIANSAPTIRLQETKTAIDTRGDATSLQVTLDHAALAGDQIVLAINESAGQAAATPAGYTLIGTFAAPNAGETTVVYRKTAGGGEATATVNFSQGVNVHAKTLIAAVYRGVDPITPLDGTPTANGTSTPTATSVTVPGLTASGTGDQLLLIAHGINNLLTATWTTPAGMTQRAHTEASTATSALSDQTLNATGTTGTRSTSTSQPAQLEGVLLALRPAPDTYYVQHDQLGSTRILTDPLGNVGGAYRYDPEGRIVAHAGAATTPLLFNGQQWDPETGLYYLRARYYDSQTAQFLTRDPLSHLTRQRYTYASDNAVDIEDPSGLTATTGDSGGGPGSVLPPLPSDYIPWQRLFQLEMAGCLTDAQYEHFLTEENNRDLLVDLFRVLNDIANQQDMASASMGRVVKQLLTTCLKGAVDSAEVGALGGPEGLAVGAVEGCGVSTISQELRDLGDNSDAAAVEEGSRLSDIAEIADALAKAIGK